jgi:hypothetical protein
MIAEQGRRLSSALALVLSSGLAASAAGQTTATFTGLNNGLWSSGGNWDLGQAPINSGPSLFNAIVDGNKNAILDMPGANEITGLALRAGSSLQIGGGSSFTVTGVSLMGGGISAAGTGTLFRADSPFASFSSAGLLSATDGARIRLGGLGVTGPEFGNIYAADGVNSRIELPSLGSVTLNLNGGCCEDRRKFFRARNGGVIDLSGLAIMVGGDDNGRIWVIPETGGSINLNSLISATGVDFRSALPSWSLPSLNTATKCALVVAPTTTLSTPSLQLLTSGSISISDGGTLNAPLLTQFVDSTIVLAPNQTLNAPLFRVINDSTFRVTGNRSFVVAATSMTSPSRSGDTFVAELTGVLDLQSLTQVSLTLNGGCCEDRRKFIRARTNGRVDLRNVVNMTGGDDNGRIVIAPESGGIIDLTRLTTAVGVSIEPRVPSFTLPALSTLTRGNIFVDVFNTVSMPALTTMNAAAVNITGGGTLNAPALTDFTDSSITLTPSTFFNAPPLQNIDGSRIRLFEGRTFSVADTSVVSTGVHGELYVANGLGTRLNLTSAQSFRLTRAGGCCEDRRKFFRAQNFGVIDASTATEFSGGDDNGRIVFELRSGGQILLGDAAISQVKIDCSGTGSTISMGSVSLNAASTVVALDLASTLRCTGSLRPTTQTEANFNTAGGRVVLDGQAIAAAPQMLEVAGADLGLPNGTIPANFQFGQLTVGQAGRPTVAVLRDDINNGNRGVAPGATEQIHLQGFPAEDGLRILAGSSLYLNNLTAYAVINNNWVRLNDLIPSGQEFVPFDGGRLYRGAPPGFIAPIAIGPRGTWLRTNNDPSAVAPVAIDLAALGILPGAEISIERLGTWATTNVWPETRSEAMGLFSSSTTVLPGTNLNRVPGAIDAGEDVLTETTANGSQPTDIPEDFAIAGETPTVLIVPNQATTLFVAVPDRFYGDNVDADQNLLIRLTLLKGPCLGDLFRDGLVDDSDFQIFAPAYDILDCADPAMPVGCPADLNKDGVVDDADFSIFVVAYDELVCP